MYTYLAIDIGASSGRHILGWVERGRICLKELYRFENQRQVREGHDCWDLEALWGHILAGLTACKAAGHVPDCVGIDTWAVDFVLLDRVGECLTLPVSYRDRRTEGMRDEVEKCILFADLYAKTGIQYQNFNTVYQLATLRREHPEQLAQAEHLLMLPDYFHYRLTGRITNEYTNATSTALVNAAGRDWDGELLDRLELPRKLFGPLHMPGTALGGFTEQVKALVGFDCNVILPATHDTGSAFLAVPARDEHAVYLSSGTWSLLGVENPVPITTAESREANFTNEGGYGGRYRYLKNIMGLWMLQSIRRELNAAVAAEGSREWSFPNLIEAAHQCADFTSVVDANNGRFLAPTSMVEEVRAACRESGQREPRSVGEVIQCVYRSLVLCYQETIRELEGLTGRRYTSINIVGGGCQDDYLNTLTAQATGLLVLAGPVEGTALGNLLAQMLAKNEFSSPEAARAAVRESFQIKEVYP